MYIYIYLSLSLSLYTSIYYHPYYEAPKGTQILGNLKCVFLFAELACAGAPAVHAPHGAESGVSDVYSKKKGELDL